MGSRPNETDGGALCRYLASDRVHQRCARDSAVARTAGSLLAHQPSNAAATLRLFGVRRVRRPSGG